VQPGLGDDDTQVRLPQPDGEGSVGELVCWNWALTGLSGVGRAGGQDPTHVFGYVRGMNIDGELDGEVPGINRRSLARRHPWLGSGGRMERLDDIRRRYRRTLAEAGNRYGDVPLAARNGFTAEITALIVGGFGYERCRPEDSPYTLVMQSLDSAPPGYHHWYIEIAGADGESAVLEHFPGPGRVPTLGTFHQPTYDEETEHRFPISRLHPAHEARLRAFAGED